MLSREKMASYLFPLAKCARGRPTCTELCRRCKMDLSRPPPRRNPGKGVVNTRAWFPQDSWTPVFNFWSGNRRRYLDDHLSLRRRGSGYAWLPSTNILVSRVSSCWRHRLCGNRMSSFIRGDLALPQHLPVLSVFRCAIHQPNLIPTESFHSSMSAFRTATEHDRTAVLVNLTNSFLSQEMSLESFALLWLVNVE